MRVKYWKFSFNPLVGYTLSKESKPSAKKLLLHSDFLFIFENRNKHDVNRVYEGVHCY